MADKDFRIDMILGAKFAEGFRALEEAKRKVEAVDRATDKFGKTGLNAGAALRTAGYAAVAAAGAATALMGLYIEKTIEAEKVQAQLQSRLKDTAGVAGRTLEQLNQQSKSLEHVTVFDDEAIGNAQAMLLTFTQIRGTNFDRAVESALNLATVMGTDAADAAKILGKALSDPEKGMSALSRAGVTFTDTQKEVIKKMLEAGQVSAAQGVLLDALRGKMGTAATAARNTLGGALQALKNAFDDVLEGDSGDTGIVGTRNAIERLIDTLNDPRTRAGVQQIVTGIAQIVQKMAEALPAIAEFNARLGEAFGLTGQGGTRKANALDYLGGEAAYIKALARGDLASASAAGARAKAGLLGGDVANFTNVAGDIDQNLVKAQRAAAKAAFDAAHPFVDHGGQGQFANVNGVNVVPEGEGVAKPPKDTGGKSKADPDADIKRRIAGLTEEAALLGQIKEGEDKASEAAKARYDITEGEFKDKSPQLKAQYLAAAEALDQKNADIEAEKKRQEAIEKSKEAYDDLLKELRTPAEVAVDDAIAKLHTLNEALQKGIANKAQVDKATQDILKQSLEKAPDAGFGQYDPFAQFDEQRRQIEAWYTAQLDMLNVFRSQRADLNAQWDQQELQLQAQHHAALMQLELAQTQMLLGSASAAFGGMAELARQFGGEQSKTYRVLFALSKGFAVAQAAVSLATNISKASEIGFPQNLPFIAGAIAQGAQILSIIAGANYSGGGGYAEGGYTGSGGKYEPAGIVHRGEGVLSQREIARLGGPGGFEQLRAAIARNEAFGTGLRGFAEGGYVGDAPALSAPNGDRLDASRSAMMQKNLRIYNSFGLDQLAQDLAKHPALEDRVVNIVAENGNAIKARW